jgi:hypothetical protein
VSHAAAQNLPSHSIAAACTSDNEEVRCALMVATNLWRRGEGLEALRWLRRAGDIADACGQGERAVALYRRAAELSDAATTPSQPPPPPRQSETRQLRSEPPAPRKEARTQLRKEAPTQQREQAGSESGPKAPPRPRPRVPRPSFHTVPPGKLAAARKVAAHGKRPRRMASHKPLPRPPLDTITSDPPSDVTAAQAAPGEGIDTWRNGDVEIAEVPAPRPSQPSAPLPLTTSSEELPLFEPDERTIPRVLSISSTFDEPFEDTFDEPFDAAAYDDLDEATSVLDGDDRRAELPVALESARAALLPGANGEVVVRLLALDEVAPPGSAVVLLVPTS